MYQKIIKQILADRQQDMVRDIARLISIQSDRQEPRPGKPYGEGPAQALAEALAIAGELGFKTRNLDNIAGTVDFGDGEPRLDILAHLDVVPAGDGWTVTGPFEPKVENGKLYGRGAMDDKGPAVAALYAMLAVREAGISLNGNVRLILGTDEECGSSDLEHYYKREKEAPMSFSPDAEFPVINIEKGGMRGKMTAKWPADDRLPRLLSLKSGFKFNVVPDKAEAAVEGISLSVAQSYVKPARQKTGVEIDLKADDGKLTIRTKGRSAHASTPSKGNNALTGLLDYLAMLPLADGLGRQCLLAMNRAFPHGDWAGRALGVAMRDDLSGELTLSLNLMEMTKTGMEAVFDCRSPICANDRNVRLVIAKFLDSLGIELEDKPMVLPHHVPEDSPLVTKLLESYESVTGKPGSCIAIGGGTYVHNLKNGVAFGAADPDVEYYVHGANEYADINQLTKSAGIYADAIVRICQDA